MDLKIKDKLHFFATPEAFYAGFSSPGLKGLSDAGRALGIIAHMDQVHGNDVLEIKGAGQYTADGIFTREKGLTLIVKTADCLPVLLYSEKEKIIGAVHMGWRSAEAGILEEIPYDLCGFTAIAGPGLRKCCYEVGREFAEKPRLKQALSRKEGKLFFDPVLFARVALRRKGLGGKDFVDSKICSNCGGYGVPSYRRSRTGKRTLTFIRRGFSFACSERSGMLS